MTEILDIEVAVDLMDKGKHNGTVLSAFEDPIKLYNLPHDKMFVVNDSGFMSYVDFLKEKNKPQLIEIISTKNTGRDISLERAEKSSPIQNPNVKADDALQLDKEEEKLHPISSSPLPKNKKEVKHESE